MRSLTRKEEYVLQYVLDDFKEGPCETCEVGLADILPDDICDRLIERGLMIERPCEIVPEMTHCAVTATGRFVLELVQILKAG